MPGFDPSGHLICALTAYANWLQFLVFVSGNELISRAYQRVLWIVVNLLFIYQLYSLFFTLMIYHDSLETLHALVYGLIIMVSVFYTDVFSDCLYSLAT